MKNIIVLFFLITSFQISYADVPNNFLQRGRVIEHETPNGVKVKIIIRGGKQKIKAIQEEKPIEIKEPKPIDWEKYKLYPFDPSDLYRLCLTPYMGFLYKILVLTNTK